MSRNTYLGAGRDEPTVRPDGSRIEERIEGVEVRSAPTQTDSRGEISEIYNPSWRLHPDPVVYVYQSMIRPHKTKGWVVHLDQDDRLFVSVGSVKIVLYDPRPDSRTQGLVNELFVGERNRCLVVVPRGVFHAVQNIGEVDAYFINLPTKPYNHADPDKYRLPLDTDKIPYSLVEGPGG